MPWKSIELARGGPDTEIQSNRQNYAECDNEAAASGLLEDLGLVVNAHAMV